MKKEYYFGQKGFWNRPAWERGKAKKIPCVVLEQTSGGVLYIFTFDKKAKNLSMRTATIFPSDFIPNKEQKYANDKR